jgi:hypothetical protein
MLQNGEVEVDDDDEWEPVECLYLPGGGGSVLTQHQSRDTEMDSQRNSRNGSSGRPGALLEISYFRGELQYIIFYTINLCLGKTTNSQDLFPAIQQWRRE